MNLIRVKVLVGTTHFLRHVIKPQAWQKLASTSYRIYEHAGHYWAAFQGLGTWDERHCKAKSFTSRQIGRPRCPTAEDGWAILENAGKGKVGLNQNPSCPKETDLLRRPGWSPTRMALVEYPEQWAWKCHESLGRQRRGPRRRKGEKRQLLCPAGRGLVKTLRC